MSHHLDSFSGGAFPPLLPFHLSASLPPILPNRSRKRTRESWPSSKSDTKLPRKCRRRGAELRCTWCGGRSLEAKEANERGRRVNGAGRDEVECFPGNRLGHLSALKSREVGRKTSRHAKGGKIDDTLDLCCLSRISLGPRMVQCCHSAFHRDILATRLVHSSRKLFPLTLAKQAAR